MRVQYDPVKAAANVRKHGVSFADAEGVLADPLAVTIEDPDAQGERRHIAIGSGNLGALLVVVYPTRSPTNARAKFEADKTPLDVISRGLPVNHVPGLLCKPCARFILRQRIPAGAGMTE